MNTPSASLSAKKLSFWSGAGASLFWLWNGIYLIFVLFGFIPALLPELVTSIVDGSIPPVFLALVLALIAVPFIAIALALTVLRKAPGRLFALGYVVEGPMMILMLIRFFIIRQGNPAIALLGWVALAGLGAFVWQLLRPAAPHRLGWAYARLGLLALLAAVVLYSSAIILFYIPPGVILFGNMIGSAFQFLVESIKHYQNIPNILSFLVLNVVGLLLLALTGTLVVGLPIAAPILGLRAGLRDLRAQLGPGRKWPGLAAAIFPVLICAGVLAVLMRQPQLEAYALLKQPPTTVEQSQVLLQHSQEIRTGLLNAYLAPFRYISAVGEVSHIRTLYEDNLKMKMLSAWNIQKAFEVVARPLLYEPFNPPDSLLPQDNVAFQQEPTEAADLYQRFFDRTIIEGEKARIVSAVSSTFDGNQAQAARLAVDDLEIHLNRQEVNITEHGDWAEVELYEVYQNQTTQRQEVVYYFSLPESAVITGVWLGNSPDRELRFAYQVAPRGAAQAVYRNEVRANLDPALVEQIGPRQYRLRVFPVLPKTPDRLPTLSLQPQPNNASPMYLWLTYNTLSENGAWPMPQLSKKFNVFWDAATIRLVNGVPAAAQPDAWLPAAVAAHEPVSLQPHRISFPSGETVTIQPVDGADIQRPAGLNLAVILDRTYSMTDLSKEVLAALDQLRQATSADLDVYLTSAPLRGESASMVSLSRLDSDLLYYFGGQGGVEMLSQFETLAGDRQYDAALVLTDGSGFSLDDHGLRLATPSFPVWIVHLNGAFPLGYDDPTLQVIQASGGGVAASISEALQRLAVRQAVGSGDLVDGYLWHVVPAGEAVTGLSDTVKNDPGLLTFAARRLVLNEMERNRGNLNQVATLDRIHAIALQNQIVTPYSSMIVLVEQRQQNLLDQMTNRGDRFDREAEDIGETEAVAPAPTIISGVPEPEEWLLLLVVVLLLAYLYRARILAAGGAR